MAGDGRLTVDQMRANLIAAFKGRAVRDDNKVDGDERAGLNRIANMTDEEITSIMQDSKLSAEEYAAIIKEGKALPFKTSEKEINENVDKFETNYSQGVAESSVAGSLQKVQKTMDNKRVHGQKLSDKPVEDDRNIFEKAWDAVKRHPVEAAVGAGLLAGAAALAFTPGGQALATAAFAGAKSAFLAASGAKILTGAMVVGGALSLVSCGKEDDVPRTEVTQTVNITITGNEDMPTLLDYIATLTAELKAGNEEVKGLLNQVIGLITKLITQNQTNADEIIALCGGNNALLETVIALLIENNELLKDNNALIEEFMTQNGNDNKKILEAIINLQKSLDNIQKTIDNLPKGIAMYLSGPLKAIYDAIKAGNVTNMSTNDYVKHIKDLIANVAQQLMELINQGSTNNQQNDWIINILSQHSDLLQRILNGEMSALQELMEMLGLLGQISGDLTEIKNNIASLLGNSNTIITKLNNIENNTEDSNRILQAIYNVIEKIRGDIGSLSATQKSYFEALLAAIEKNGSNLDDILAMLDVINNNLVAGNEAQQQAADKILAALARLNFNVVGGMDKIFKAILAGNQTAEQINQKVSVVLRLLEKMYAAQNAGLEIGNQILALLGGLGFDISDKLEAILDAVINKEFNFDVEKLTALLEKINANVESNGAAAKEFYVELLSRLDKMDNDMVVNMEAILNAINKNGDIGKGLKTLLKAILDKMGEMDDTNKQGFKDVIEAIKNISVTGGTPDLSAIEALLVEIRDLSKENGIKLDLLGKQNETMITILKSFKAEVSTKLNIVNDKLDQLDENQKEIIEYLKKLNNGMNVIINKLTNIEAKSDVDFERLMAKLDEILKAIKDHKVEVDVTGKITCECNCGGGHNEGIIGELEDLVL